jgi:type VI secretion system protein ImpK
MELERSLLLNQFYDFYSEVIRQKKRAQSYAEVPLAERAPEPEEAPYEEEEGAQTVSRTLLSLLEEQALEAGRRGGEYGVSFYKEAQYIMAALADEIFLNMDWEGREAWKSGLLEFKLFGTHVAGELFFQKLDALLGNRDPAFVEIAALYLQALSLGFRGKFRDIDDEGKLDYYRRQLFSFIFHKNPDLLNPDRLLYPEAYAHTLAEGEGKKLPYVRRWIIVALLLMLAFLGISHGIWANVTVDLKQVIQQILLGG